MLHLFHQLNLILGRKHSPIVEGKVHSLASTVLLAKTQTLDLTSLLHRFMCRDGQKQLETPLSSSEEMNSLIFHQVPFS